MASVERCKEICALQQEPQCDNTEIALNWPHKGEIEFKNVNLTYLQENNFEPHLKDIVIPLYSLKNINFKVTHGQKIGIVGRTGAGKSSLIQSIFRMYEPEGNIILDGVDTKSINLQLLRQSITIIPQTPVVFCGSIKRNLDPFEKLTDEEVYQILNEVNLKKYVESLDDKINTDMTNAENVFSVGQKQLICLARAMINKSQIIILDEATSNIDKETDEYIQTKIKEDFKKSTILTIAHRIVTVASCDKIMVLNKGNIVEFQHPYELLVSDVNDSKKNRKISSKGYFANMVLKTGEEMQQEIFKICRETYKQK